MTRRPMGKMQRVPTASQTYPGPPPESSGSMGDTCKEWCCVMLCCFLLAVIIMIFTAMSGN